MVAVAPYSLVVSMFTSTPVSSAEKLSVLGGGGFEVLRFPPDPQELFRVITQAWRRWRQKEKAISAW